jgi:hypothetical protein
MNNFVKRISKTKSRNGFFGAVTWAINHRRKFKERLESLEKCIEGLEFVATNLDLFGVRKQIVEVEISTISDLSVLQNLVIVRPDDVEEMDTVPDAVSARIRLLQSYAFSHRTDADTFVTAPSQPELEASPTASRPIQTLPTRHGPGVFSSTGASTPQNRRIMEEVLQRSGGFGPSQLPFALDDTDWGQKLTRLIQYDSLQFKTMHIPVLGTTIVASVISQKSVLYVFQSLCLFDRKRCAHTSQLKSLSLTIQFAKCEQQAKDHIKEEYSTLLLSSHRGILQSLPR